MKFNRDQLITQLTGNVCKVTFIKKNNERRVMECTLRSDIVPPYERKTEVTESAEPSPVVSVWDLEKAAWRSFRVDRVLDVEVE